VAIVPDGVERTTQRLAYSARDVLPRSAALIEAFRRTTGDGGQDPVLKTASDMAAHHTRQWHAEDASRDPDASAVDLAASKRLIDGLNARRIVLVERIDDWAGGRIPHSSAVSLHTETAGSVIDRLSIAWVRANELISSGDDHDRARVALRQLGELAQAYDDLVRDVAAGRRRLPNWRALKAYRSQS
jgi:hypothetical protein